MWWNERGYCNLFLIEGMVYKIGFVIKGYGYIWIKNWYCSKNGIVFREVLNINMWCIKIFIKILFFWLIIVLKNCFIKFNLFLNLFIENLNF